ncbi:glycoside hydrolase family 16 protein [Terrimonas sp. NA20]|uniref:Glycoside hydrolase family 16 protein n=1 Tax=Terrimonas ginsenosidimutans TaxID=2908004 RepID=A0ABS9KU75_9BACT|nr:glycoside hydrolase family 16 protein [Terrimonas ginsenosidimutans]MCG2615892.1 glycoside hydrolase family 16 protein [Terrimonas ginsenosidimutans]
MRSSLIACLFVAFTFSAFAQNKKWKLVWSDEFSYTGLPDSTKWTAEVGGNGWGNNELQYYTAGRSENARVARGVLTIEARKEDWKEKNYTSARLITKNKGDWQYGKVEVRAKLPKGLGTWPAIWMLGSVPKLRWPDDGEIDIMEHVGYNHGMVYGTIHCKKYNHVIHTQKSDSVYLKDLSEKFHVYTVEWDKDVLKIGVDGRTFFTFNNDHTGYDAWPFDNKMFLILNIAVGGNWGGSRGVADNIWPQKMEVDYVRVYKEQSE